ncbi:hypothetical protein NHQ30_009809 [Ciborinia camelliae]|nr:hypothetical protein NHQ30_009809 [Ciborinia camelliae]
MTGGDGFLGKNIRKKHIGNKYGNPGCLTSETREVKGLMRDMASLGMNTPSRIQRDVTRAAPYPPRPAPSNNRPSSLTTATSSSRGGPITFGRRDVPEQYSNQSAPMSSSSYNRADEYTRRPVESASSRAATEYGDNYRNEGSWGPPKSSKQMSSTLSSSFSRGHNRGRAYPAVPISRPKERYENSSSQRSDQRYDAPSSSSSRIQDRGSEYSAAPPPRQEPRYENDSLRLAPIRVRVEVGRQDVYFYDGSRECSTDRYSWKQSSIDGRAVRLYKSRSGQKYYYVPGVDDLDRRTMLKTGGKDRLQEITSYKI